MSTHIRCVVAAAALAAAGPCPASLIVDYGSDAGGANDEPLDGLSARAEFRLDGTTLTITLSNTSAGVPAGAEVSDSLLVSLAFSLPGGVTIAAGESALIAPGSGGLGVWSGLGAGDSVGDEWLWTNDGGGDLLEVYSQVISTSNGQGGGETTSFEGELDPNVNGPFGGIAAAPPVLAVPGSKRAVSNAIVFTLTLSAVLTDTQLRDVARGSVVEFGSNYQYLAVPEPGTAALLALSALVAVRSRRRPPVTRPPRAAPRPAGPRRAR